MSLSPFSLCTLEQYKVFRKSGSEDNDQSKDEYFEDLINRASDSIENNYLMGRKILARNYFTWEYLSPNQTLQPLQFPVISVYGAYYGNSSALTLTYSGTSINNQIIVNNDNFTLITTATDGTSTTNVFSFEDNASTDALTTAINTASIGWTAVLNVNVPVWKLRPITYNSSETTINVVYAEQSIGTEVDSQGTRVRVRPNNNLPWGTSGYWGNWQFNTNLILLNYRGGYEVVPTALTMATIQLATLYDKSYADVKNPSDVIAKIDSMCAGYRVLTV